MGRPFLWAVLRTQSAPGTRGPFLRLKCVFLRTPPDFPLFTSLPTEGTRANAPFVLDTWQDRLACGQPVIVARKRNDAQGGDLLIYNVDSSGHMTESRNVPPSTHAR